MWCPFCSCNDFVEGGTPLGAEHLDHRLLLGASAAVRWFGCWLAIGLLLRIVRDLKGAVSQCRRAQCQWPAFFVMPPDGVEVSGDDLFDQPVFQQALADIADRASLQAGVDTIAISTLSRLSAPRSLMNDASDTTWDSSTFRTVATSFFSRLEMSLMCSYP